jgi:two-component system, cell cycle response regulator
MCAAQPYPSIDTPDSLSRLPISDAIRGLAGLAVASARNDGADAEQIQSSVAVLVDTEVDGARYLLVRMPRLEGRVLEEPSTRLPAPRNVADGLVSERRHRFGNLRRVLIAESDRATRLHLHHLLREWGFTSEVATDGIEALMFLEQHRAPDLLVLNRSLPGIGGIELCRRVTSELNGQPPYILITGRQSGRRDVAECLESGASEYLKLPFVERELKARLTVAVRTLARQDNLIRSRERFRDQATRDALTGIWNRRGILEILEEELDRAERNDRATGILMLDVDHFKTVNDTHGHLAGDRVLQESARRLSKNLRAYDCLGRYGGEEFLIVVPATDERELCELAERIRAGIESEPVHTELDDIQITFSIGATMAKPGERSIANAVAVADKALYRAKELGRNRVLFGEIN